MQRDGSHGYIDMGPELRRFIQVINHLKQDCAETNRFYQTSWDVWS